jgi:hypothetical protein
VQNIIYARGRILGVIVSRTITEIHVHARDSGRVLPLAVSLHSSSSEQLLGCWTVDTTLLGRVCVSVCSVLVCAAKSGLELPTLAACGFAFPPTHTRKVKRLHACGDKATSVLDSCQSFILTN